MEKVVSNDPQNQAASDSATTPPAPAPAQTPPSPAPDPAQELRTWTERVSGWIKSLFDDKKLDEKYDEFDKASDINCFIMKNGGEKDTGERFTVTTPLYYVNAAPHMGSAYPTIAADAQSREVDAAPMA